MVRNFKILDIMLIKFRAYSYEKSDKVIKF